MRLIIVDPSPLARNVYRLLVQRLARDVRVVELDTLAQLSCIEEGENLCGIIIGSVALEGEAQRYRMLFTDISMWAALPKLVVKRYGAHGMDEVWEGLPNTQLLARPFLPDDFIAAVSGMAPAH